MARELLQILCFCCCSQFCASRPGAVRPVHFGIGVVVGSPAVHFPSSIPSIPSTKIGSTKLGAVSIHQNWCSFHPSKIGAPPKLVQQEKQRNAMVNFQLIDNTRKKNKKHERKGKRGRFFTLILFQLNQAKLCLVLSFRKIW